MENGAKVGGGVKMRQNKDMLQVLELEWIMPEIFNEKSSSSFLLLLFYTVSACLGLTAFASFFTCLSYLHFTLPSFYSSPHHLLI